MKADAAEAAGQAELANWWRRAARLHSIADAQQHFFPFTLSDKYPAAEKRAKSYELCLQAFTELQSSDARRSDTQGGCTDSFPSKLQALLDASALPADFDAVIATNLQAAGYTAKPVTSQRELHNRACALNQYLTLSEQRQHCLKRADQCKDLWRKQLWACIAARDSSIHYWVDAATMVEEDVQLLEFCSAQHRQPSRQPLCGILQCWSESVKELRLLLDAASKAVEKLEDETVDRLASLRAERTRVRTNVCTYIEVVHRCFVPAHRAAHAFTGAFPAPAAGAADDENRRKLKDLWRRSAQAFQNAGLSRVQKLQTEDSSSTAVYEHYE